MYCQQCGTKCSESAVFCTNCGTRLHNTQTAAPQNNSSTVNTSNNANVQFRTAVKYSSNPVLNEIKKLAASPLMIITAIAFSLMIIFYISNSEAISVDFVGYVRLLLEESGSLDYDSITGLEIIEDLFSSAARIFAFIIMIPDIVIATGLWITVCSAFNKADDSMSVSGLKAIRVITTISLVLTIIGMCLYILGSLSIIINVNKLAEKVPFLLILLLLVILAAIIFRIYCLSKMNELIDGFKYAIEAKYPANVSPFVAILTFISGGGYVLSALVGIGAGGDASTWCGAIAFIGFGLLILRYRSTMAPMRILSATETETTETETDGSSSEENQIGSITVQNDIMSRLKPYHKYIGLAIVIPVVALIIFLVSSSTAPGIDKDIVGKWQYGDSREQVMEFKRNGVYIGNKGTEHEEVGTYTAQDGVISVKIDGEVTDREYRVLDSDVIQIYRSYLTSNWQREYRWETLYRVD